MSDWNNLQGMTAEIEAAAAKALQSSSNTGDTPGAADAALQPADAHMQMRRAPYVEKHRAPSNPEPPSSEPHSRLARRAAPAAACLGQSVAREVLSLGLVVRTAAEEALAAGRRSSTSSLHAAHIMCAHAALPIRRWALLLQDQVRQVQQHVQREQARPRLQPPARAAPNRTPHPARDCYCQPTRLSALTAPPSRAGGLLAAARSEPDAPEGTRALAAQPPAARRRASQRADAAPRRTRRHGCFRRDLLRLRRFRRRGGRRPCCLRLRRLCRRRRVQRPGRGGRPERTC